MCGLRNGGHFSVTVLRVQACRCGAGTQKGGTQQSIIPDQDHSVSSEESPPLSSREEQKITQTTTMGLFWGATDKEKRGSGSCDKWGHSCHSGRDREKSKGVKRPGAVLCLRVPHSLFQRRPLGPQDWPDHPCKPSQASPSSDCSQTFTSPLRGVLLIVFGHGTAGSTPITGAANPHLSRGTGSSQAVGFQGLNHNSSPPSSCLLTQE